MLSAGIILKKVYCTILRVRTLRIQPILFAALVVTFHHVSAAVAGPALLFEATTGKVLYDEDMDHRWHPASLTKIMTAYIVFEELKAGKLKLDSKVVCSKTAKAEPPSKIGLPVGAELTVDTALKALIIKSANDVAVMLAEKVGGTKEAFITRMNRTARRLGMSNTNFVNPNGLPARHQITTARDLAKLSKAVVKEFPQYAHYWTMPSFRLGKRRLSSHNGMLKTFEGSDGLKTGFICDSGFNVVASATRNGTRLIAVVLGEPNSTDRTIRASSLLEYGFQQYGWKTYFSSRTIDNAPLPEKIPAAKSIRNTVTSYSCGNRSAALRKRRALNRAKASRMARKLGLPYVEERPKQRKRRKRSRSADGPKKRATQ